MIRVALAVVTAFALFAYPLKAQTFPSRIVASSGNVANAVATATMPAVASRTNWVTSILVTAGGATAAAVVTCTVTGFAGGTMTFIYGAPLGAGVPAVPLSLTFYHPAVASGQNVAIVASCPALGAGNTRAAITLIGFIE